MKIIGVLFIVILGFSCNTSSTKRTKISTETNDQKLAPDYSVAVKFINDYVEFCNPTSPHGTDLTWIERNPLLTNHFKAVYKNLVDSAYRVEPEVGLDFDPIFDGNDFPDKGFEIIEKDDLTGYVKLKGKDCPEFKLVMKVVKHNDKWLVDGSGIINIPKDRQASRD